MKDHKYSLKLTLFLITLVFSVISNAEQETLKLGVILDTSPSLNVKYIGKGDKAKLGAAAVLSGGLGGFIVGAAEAQRNTKYASKLNQTIGDDFDYKQVFKDQLVDAFANKSAALELVFLPTSLLTSKGKLDFSKVDETVPFSYILTVSETPGLASPRDMPGTLTAWSHVKLRVYDLNTKKRVFKEAREAISLDVNENADDAVESPDTFTSGYPIATRQLTSDIYGRLYAENVFYNLAKGSAFESEFPSPTLILEKHASRFDFVQAKKIKKWRVLKDDSHYMYRFIPRNKKDNKVIGIITNIDLLIEEYGQNFDSIEQYLNLYLSRLENNGFDVSSITDAPVLEFEDDMVSYMMPRSDNGYFIHVHKKVEDFIVTHEIVILESDPELLLTKYKEQIQNYIDKSELVIH